MTLGSLFDGSGGFPLAGVINGICPVWASEIEAYPLRVTARRFPQMEQLGDVKDIDGTKIQPVDVITFGSPCQDLSVAGAQKGIHEGERSNLFFEAIRIIREMRGATNEKYPRFAVWENVPGAFSSNKGQDFRAVLEAFCQVSAAEVSVPEPPKGKWQPAGCIVGDGYSIAWRVYDAQYWGVPQRRKRIYLVADFASERAGEILFERESMRGNPAESREAREGASDDAAGGAGGSNFYECMTNRGYPCGVISETLRAGSHGAIPMVAAFMGGQGFKAGGIGYSEKVSPTLKSVLSGGNTVPDVVYQNTGVGWWNESHVAETLRTPCGGDSTKANIVVYDCRGNGDGSVVPNLTGDHEQTELGDKTGALNCMHDQQMILAKTDEPQRKYIVRRLTPLECCRLQGFPDWWEDGVQGSDSARYKMWGNGIARPCAVDVLRRIVKEVRD